MKSVARTTTKIHTSVYKDIEKALPRIMKRNTPKYDSVSDFVNTACIELLDREGITVETCCQ